MTKVSQYPNSRHFRDSYYWLAGIVCIASILFFVDFKQGAVLAGKVKQDSAKFWAQAVEQEGKGELAQAIVSFRQYQEANGPDQTASRHLSDLYAKTGQLNQALEAARQYAKAAPDASDAFFQLGVVYQLLGQEKEAAESYQKSVDLDPKYAEGYFNLGFLSETGGHLLEAIGFYKKAVEADPKHAKAYYNLGNAYAALDKDEDAVRSYQAAVANNPNYMDAFVNLSIILTKNGNYKEAIHYLDEARLLGYEPPEEFLNSLEIYREKETAGS